MAKRQTRRSISIRIESYARLQAIAETLKTSTSQIVEEHISDLGRLYAIPEPDRATLIAEAEQKRETRIADDIRTNFSF